MTRFPLRWLAALPLAFVLLAPAPADAAKKKAARPAAAAKAAPAKKTQTKAEQLQRLYAEYWDASLALNPLQARFLNALCTRRLPAAFNLHGADCVLAPDPWQAPFTPA